MVIRLLHTSAGKTFRNACARALAGIITAMFVAGWVVPEVFTSTSAENHPLPPSYIYPNIDTTAYFIENPLTEADAARYKAIFAAHEQGNWEMADRLMDRLSNRALVGNILAERFLNKKYNARFDELAEWLVQYGNEPAAANIYYLAVKKDKTMARALSRPVSAKSFSTRAVAQDNKHSIIRNEGARIKNAGIVPAQTWQAGLAAYRRNDAGLAARHFSTLARLEKLPASDVAAAAYWAYRCYDKLNDDDKAADFLELAAEYPRTFYGVLARRSLGQSLEVNAASPSISGLTSIDAVRRAATWMALDNTDRAQQELKLAFATADEPTRQQLLGLAMRWDMAALQLQMGAALKTTEGYNDYALYPTPGWKPEAGYVVDPALLYAVARQESRFDVDAKSPAGALGVMQLMPTTAHRMARDTELDSISAWSLKQQLAQPTTNVMLGQNYLQHLIENPITKGNLVYVVASYNAGPGRLLEWKRNTALQNDPLLFIESIPFDETRNYVVNVLANYWIYSELMGHESPSVVSLLDGEWPVYEAENLWFASLSEKSAVGF